jgi:hypothetical protein
LPLHRYDNTQFFWWVLLPLGPNIGRNGLVKVGYGAAGVGNPEETYTLNCRLTPSAPTQLHRQPVQLDPESPGCYWYTGQKDDWVAGVAEFLQLDILQFVQDNAARGVFTYLDAQKKQPDLSRSVEGLRLHVCGISPAVFNTLVQLGKQLLLLLVLLLLFMLLLLLLLLLAAALQGRWL